MSDTRIILDREFHVGNNWTFTCETNVDGGTSANAAKDVTTGTVILAADPDRQTNGTCTSAGTTLTIISSDRTEADDFWIGCPITFVDKTDGRQYQTRVTDSTSSTTTLAVQGLPVASTLSDTYTLPLYPLLPQATVNTSGNSGTYTFTGSNLFAYAGKREVHYKADFGTDSEWCVFELEVLP